MAHRSRCRPAAQDVEHVANASYSGRDRSPVAVHAPHWDNRQPLTNWYRDQLMAKIEELHHPRRAQLRIARVPTLVKALQELGFDPSAEHNGGSNQQHGETKHEACWDSGFRIQDSVFQDSGFMQDKVIKNSLKKHSLFVNPNADFYSTDMHNKSYFFNHR